MNSPYFTIHSITAMDARSFSIWRANIDNAPDQIDKARLIFPETDWYFEFHHFKYDLTPVVK